MTAAFLGAVLVATPAPALAGTNGTAAGSEAVGSGTWGVVATRSTSSPPPTGPLAVTSAGNAVFYFQVVNDGTISLAGATYTVSISAVNAKLAVVACSVAWTQTGPGACSGTKTTLDTWIDGKTGPGQVASGTAVSSKTAPAAPASEIYLQATPGGVPPGGATFTVNMAVSTSQLRARQTTNA